VSSNFPDYPPAVVQNGEDSVSIKPPSWEGKSGLHGWALSAVLFFLTFISASFAGLFYVAGDLGLGTLLAVFSRPSLILLGLPFSVPLIGILLAHELGHYCACRYYGMCCTPPYFIPAPIILTGTLGAFIKIKSQFVHKRALFDIGVAGPLTGFIFTVPALWIGISLSKVIPKNALGPGAWSFGEPIIFRIFGSMILGYSPDKQDMLAHPIAMAAWVGILATSLNLLPIWQLDGGHICYAILGRSRQKRISVYAVVALIFVSFLGWPTPSYLLFGLVLLIIGARFRFYHPPTLMDDEDIGLQRFFVGILTLLILILCFIPVPITIT
jgi:membrane-associated protease RseP (regulator of RpoE activity)